MNKVDQNFRDKKNIINIILYYKFELILLFLTVFGLVLKFFHLFLSIEFNSDNVFAGLSTIEFWKYHNYFFSYYYVPAYDNYIPEVIVFHLLPQILSNYDPSMLKMVAFFIFLLIIVIFSYIIFLSTKSLLNTLFFSALLSNWYLDYSWMSATSHEGTIFTIGILLILYIFKPIKNWDIIFLAILSIVTFSDSLVLIWFTIPILFTIIITNLLRLSLREQIVSFLKFDIVFKIVFVSIVVTIFKKFFIEYYISHTNVFHCMELSCLINTQIPLFLKDLVILFNFHRIENSQIMFVFVVFLIAYAILSIKNFRSISKKDILFLFIFICIMLVAASSFYIAAAMVGSARYLKFILIGILSIFCLADFNKSKYVKWLLLSIIIINLIYVIDIPFNTHPNEEQYQLIDFLKKSNLSFGYGDYYDSNVITYLSHEDVIIRPILIENGVVPYYWMSAKRWYENPPKKFFVIVKNTNEKALNYYYNNYILPEPIQIIDYKNYKIFEYNTLDSVYHNNKKL